MTIQIIIDPAVESVGIQTINVALGKTNRTDEEARTDLANHLKVLVAQLYVTGDKKIRETADSSAAVNAASTYITAI
jgi:hypothetical protein